MEAETFLSIDDYREFAGSVLCQRRFVHTDEQKRFLVAVLKTSDKRIVIQERGSSLWRAQSAYQERLVPGEHDDDGNVMYSIPESVPATLERMKPHRNRASEGRVNPKGIPCLYLSTDRSTAMSEVRPWLGALITIAEFKLVRDLRIVNCSADPPVRNRVRFLMKRDNVSSHEKEQCVWSDINRAFAIPVDRNDDVADYAPTQVISEAFGSQCDGVMFTTKLGDGQNVALFDLDAAEVASRQLCQVGGLKYTFSDISPVTFELEHEE